MKIPSDRTTTAVGLILVVCVAISLGLFFGFGNNRAYRTLFFPSADMSSAGTSTTLTGESRRVPAYGGLQKDADQLIRELILGPADPSLGPLLGPGTRLIAVVATGRDLYVNLTADLLVNPGSLPPEEQIQGIASNLTYNFPRIRRTYVLIDGHAPDFSPMTGDPRYDFRQGVPPQTPLLQ